MKNNLRRVTKISHKTNGKVEISSKNKLNTINTDIKIKIIEEYFYKHYFLGGIDIQSNKLKLFTDYRYEHAKLIEINHDSIKFDNDIDMDREKTMEQLGFKDYTEINANTSQENNKKPKSIKEKMELAKAKSDRLNIDSKSEKNISIEKEV